MKRSEVTSVLALLAVAAAVAVAAAADMSPPAGYTTKEDESSYYIKQIGTFAVNVYKMANMCQMYYNYMSQCWSMPAGGGATYYWMVLTATNGTGAAGQYVANVWGVRGSQSSWKLLSFDSTS